MPPELGLTHDQEPKGPPTCTQSSRQDGQTAPYKSQLSLSPLGPTPLERLSQASLRFVQFPETLIQVRQQSLLFDQLPSHHQVSEPQGAVPDSSQNFVVLDVVQQIVHLVTSCFALSHM